SRAASNPSTNPDGVVLAGALELRVGALIPSRTHVVLPDNATSVTLRTISGERVGRNWAVAAMLPENSLSWDMRLVAGADTQAADARQVQPTSSGRIVMGSRHYTTNDEYNVTQAGGTWYWTREGARWWGTTPGTPVDSAF